MASIITLPIELQAHILSYLSFFHQIPASQVCRLWEAILCGRGFAESRYPTESDPKDLFGIHKLINLHYGHREWFIGCTIDPGTGKIAKYYLYHASYRPGGARRPRHFQAISVRDKKKYVETDISQSPFLNEALFSPFLDLKDLDAEVALINSMTQQERTKLDRETLTRYEIYRAYIGLVLSFKVTIWVTIPGTTMFAETRFDYTATKRATILQLIEGVWEKFRPMLETAAFEFAEPFQMDFAMGKIEESVFLNVILWNGRYKNGLPPKQPD